MGFSSWELVCGLLKAGEIDDALFLLDQDLAEDKAVHDNLVNSVGDYLKYFFSNLPEERMEMILRQRYFPTDKIDSNPLKPGLFLKTLNIRVLEGLLVNRVSRSALR